MIGRYSFELYPKELILEENQILTRIGAADRTEVHPGKLDNVRFSISISLISHKV